MITPRCGVIFAQGDEDRASPGLLYGMTLTGTACALRDFAHAQNHPSDGRPHAKPTTDTDGRIESVARRVISRIMLHDV